MVNDATNRLEAVVRRPHAIKWTVITLAACLAVAFGLTIGTPNAMAGDGAGNRAGNGDRDRVNNGAGNAAVDGAVKAAVDGAEKATKKATEPDWQRLDTALALAKVSDKLIIVNFYTDWCPNCRRMNEKTYRDEGVLKQLNESFISVKLNAESSRPLIIEGQTVTEYQVALMFRVGSYPTTWFLTSEGRPLLPVKGYYGPDLFAPMLRFVEGGWYEKMDFDMYMEREKRGKK